MTCAACLCEVPDELLSFPLDAGQLGSGTAISIIPIHKLNKKPTEYATLCDITCDSDGIVDKFVDLHDIKPVLELHNS
jgi:arginine decarboxylase-like protein